MHQLILGLAVAVDELNNGRWAGDTKKLTIYFFIKLVTVGCNC